MTADLTLLHRAERVRNGQNVHNLANLLVAYGWYLRRGDRSHVLHVEREIRALVAESEAARMVQVSPMSANCRMAFPTASPAHPA